MRRWKPASPSLLDLPVGPRIDADRRRQTWTQLSEARVAVIERNAHRHALNDLGEVARGVFRRDHTEYRTGARRQALDMAVEGFARQHIGDDRRRLTRYHVRELVFLEVGVDPEALCRDHADEISAASNKGAYLGGAVADITLDRRAD